jgi:hypothetical protein
MAKLHFHPRQVVLDAQAVGLLGAEGSRPTSPRPKQNGEQASQCDDVPLPTASPVHFRRVTERPSLRNTAAVT